MLRRWLVQARHARARPTPPGSLTHLLGLLRVLDSALDSALDSTGAPTPSLLQQGRSWKHTLTSAPGQHTLIQSRPLVARRPPRGRTCKEIL